MSSTSSNIIKSASMNGFSFNSSTIQSISNETDSFSRRTSVGDKATPGRQIDKLSLRSTSSAKSTSKSISSHSYETECIKVAVRCRPMSEKEIADGHESIVEFACDKGEIIIRNPNLEPSNLLGTRKSTRRNHSKVFKFDAVFDWNSKQDHIYNEVCRPIVDSVLQGFNGTIFAYGQTGTGKTYTMEGINPMHTSTRRASTSSSLVQPIDELTEDLRGVIPKTFEHIFKHIAESPNTQYLVRSSYLEIYQEEIRDLLGKDHSKRLELHEHPEVGVFVKDLTSFVCKSIKEIERVMKVGNQNRSVGATDMNEHSSRSHAIFMITIEQQQHISKSESQTINGTQSATIVSSKTLRDKRLLIKVGKLNLVDLAGSERQRKTNSLGQRQKEAIKINLSLSALGNVINALMTANGNSIRDNSSSKSNSNSNFISESDVHIPYRDSKLTRLLQDSLGGNAKTLMLANIGPASYNYDETIDTLSYASRAKSIQNRPKINEDPKDALLREFQREIETLKTRLATIKERKKKENDLNLSTTTNNSVIKMVEKGLSSGNSNHLNADINDGDLWVHQNEQQQQEKKQYLSSQSVEQEINTNQQDEENSEQYKELQSLIAKLKSLESKLLNSQDDAFNDNANNNTTNELTTRKPQQKTTAIKSTILEKSDNLDLIIGGYTSKQEFELEKRRQQLVNFKEVEQDIRLKLSKQEELELETKQTFSSLQQELDMKTSKLQSIESHVQMIKKEIEQTQNANRLELNELDQVQGVLLKELKLKYLIMNNFIPKEYSDRLFEQNKLIYDEKDNTCHLRPSLAALKKYYSAASLSPLSSDSSSSTKFELIDRATKKNDENNDDAPPATSIPRYRNDESLRARSRFEKIAESIGTNIRYRYKNIFEKRLIIPKCTLRSYQAPLISPKIQAALNNALSKQEEDIFI